ncbi:MAG: nuclear transport factor 2 family protein [Bacteroidales bacterium]
MKNLFIVFCGLVFITSCEMKSTKQTVDLNAEIEKVELVLEKYVIANEKQDIDLVHEIWAPEPDIVVFGTNSNERLMGWDQIRNALENQFNSFEDTYISVHDQVININETGNTAWFSEVLNYNYIYQGEAVQYEGLRFTGVLQKKNGEWFIVQSHMSIPGSSE